jgi:hypothetical protein
MTRYRCHKQSDSDSVGICSEDSSALIHSCCEHGASDLPHSAVHVTVTTPAAEFRPKAHVDVGLSWANLLDTTPPTARARVNGR